jgi:hypothetical protein
MLSHAPDCCRERHATTQIDPGVNQFVNQLSTHGKLGSRTKADGGTLLCGSDGHRPHAITRRACPVLNGY